MLKKESKGTYLIGYPPAATLPFRLSLALQGSRCVHYDVEMKVHPPYALRLKGGTNLPEFATWEDLTQYYAKEPLPGTVEGKWALLRSHKQPMSMQKTRGH
jgi:hypothetical protein